MNTVPYFEYQEVGGDYLATRERCGLHDEMGVGKTAQTWNAIDRIGAERGIIIAPAHLRDNWIGEGRKFSPTQRRVCKGVNVHDFEAWRRGRFHILVTSYEQATAWRDRICNAGEVLDFVALDEAHYLKNGNTNRAKAILGPDSDGWDGILEWALHGWHVTGTPMYNDPLDIYTFLRMCGVMPLDKESFIKRYFHKRATAYSVRTEPRPEMVEELRALIFNNAIRRTEKDVGLQLPPVYLTTSLVDGDTQEVAAMLKATPGLEQAIIQAVNQGGLSNLGNFTSYVSTLRRLIGEAKVVPYGWTLREEILADPSIKRVVFGIHITVLERLSAFLTKHGIKNVIVNGFTKDKAACVKQFQEDPETTVFLGNMIAAGTGNTLTASCLIDVLESDWAPSGNAQAIKRVHRIGQRNIVRGRFITLARSFDEVVNRVVAHKTTTIATVSGEAMLSSPLDDCSQFV